MSNKRHIIYLSVCLQCTQPICWSCVDISHLSSLTLLYDYDGKTVYIVCDHHLVVIAQPQRTLTPPNKTHTHTHTDTHTHTWFV